jgi:hypothetical protein
MPHFVANDEGPRMTDSLRKALARLPSYEQDRIAQYLLDLIAKDEADWDAAFAGSGDKLDKLRNEALKAFHAGETRLLDPEKL